MSKHAASGAGLLEDSALRESENEIIDRITAKAGGTFSDITYIQVCELEKLALLNECRRSKFCKMAHVRAALEDMCVSGNLAQMSLRAFEQFICILGVVLGCILLYVLLCVVEKTILALMGKNKEKPT